jgi:hypothetical protein
VVGRVEPCCGHGRLRLGLVIVLITGYSENVRKGLRVPAGPAAGGFAALSPQRCGHASRPSA